jgi:hypothetical protein
VRIVDVEVARLISVAPRGELATVIGVDLELVHDDGGRTTRRVMLDDVAPVEVGPPRSF